MLVTDATFHWSKVEVKEEAFSNIASMRMTELRLAEKSKRERWKEGARTSVRTRKKKIRRKGEVKK